MRYEIITNENGYVQIIKHNIVESKNIYELDLSKYDFSGLKKYAHKLVGKELVFDEAYYQDLIEEKTKKENQKEIATMKKYLSDTDYLVARTFEQVMELTNPLTWVADVLKITIAFTKKYKDVIAKRKEYRKMIEELGD